jgi:hypothetical protein
VRSASGTITSFEAPGASADAWPSLLTLAAKGAPFPTQGTGGLGINTAGDITGAYFDASGLTHGFVRSSKGVITDFSIPGASAGALIGGTGSIGINTAGKVTGAYLDSSSIAHGFILTPTTTTLTSSLNPSNAGQSVMFTAKVTSSAGDPTNGETVTFMDGTTVLGTGTLSAGEATLTTSTLPVGTDEITAVYANDSSLLGSTSKALKQVVKK